jgi:hypothetical protein
MQLVGCRVERRRGEQQAVLYLGVARGGEGGRLREYSAAWMQAALMKRWG